MKSNTKMISMIAALVAGLVGVIPVLMTFAADEADLNGPVENSVYATFVVFAVALVLALGSALRGMVVNPTGIRNAIIGIGALGLVIAISFGMADGSEYAKFKTDETTAYYVSAGINAFYLVGLLTLVSVLYSAVARIIK